MLWVSGDDPGGKRRAPMSQAAALVTRKKAIQISIVRAEGPHELCGRQHVFDGPDCWQRASAWLRSQAGTFPRAGGYDKHDFSVTFEDGYVYEGRLDCQHPTCEGPDLDVAEHVHGFLLFYTGKRKPAHLSQKLYDDFLMRSQEMVSGCGSILAEYEIPG